MTLLMTSMESKAISTINSTMKKINQICLAFLSILTFSPFLLADYKDRMKERLPKIIEAKGTGLIGEGVDGFLHLRGKKEKTVVQLVTVENEDRKEFFKVTSKKLGSTTQEVAQKFSQVMKSRDEKSFWQKDSKGSWVQK